MSFRARVASCASLVALVACSSATTSNADAGAGDTSAAPDATVLDSGHARVPAHHRADDSQCTAPAPAGNCTIGGGAGMCSMDSQCTTGTSGRCNMNMGGAIFCRCTYDTCMHDADCPTGQTCACHGADFHPDSNACVRGNCRVDSDCGSSGYCSPTIGGCGGLAGYYCHTAGDTCVDDTDCTGSLQACVYDTTAMHWTCMNRMLCP